MWLGAREAGAQPGCGLALGLAHLNVLARRVIDTNPDRLVAGAKGRDVGLAVDRNDYA